MADVESFTKWALAQGVTLNGIVALRRPGRGVGFIAERRIEVCTVICFVYHAALLYFDLR